MAFVAEEYCRKCEKMTNHINLKCTYCEGIKERAKLADWNALPTEERLQDLRRRVEALEAPPPTY